ncbi:ATP-binding cassette domain-containing protein [Streptomyces sp. IBSNAI002]|uniref:ABC transporter ATP-binding protein C-terminal domain-containing protein n=1 Tax=Streptomyces sp. IBSNAI002 TaxID=3457500 RepID=UPI003FD10362
MAGRRGRGGGGGPAADLVAFPARRSRERARREHGERVLAGCGIGALGSSYAGGLPVGQARMVELARAVADPPRVLLLDEPASGMSAPERERLASVVRRLAREEGCAVLLVEHNVAFVMDLCARVVVLDLGSVLAEGPPAAVRADPLVREAYLGTA